MSVRAISLFSGGLDSILAVKLIGEQGIEIEGIAFETPFFDLLRKYLKEHVKGPGYVQTVLDMPLLDARSIHAELT